MFSFTFGATTERRLISSSVKKRSATLIIPFLPSFLLSKLFQMVMLESESCNPNRATTVNNLSEGIWSITAVSYTHLSMISQMIEIEKKWKNVPVSYIPKTSLNVSSEELDIKNGDLSLIHI